MNELAEPVGFAVYLYYYSSKEAAESVDSNNLVGSSSSYIVGDGVSFSGYKIWIIADNSSGTSPKDKLYPNGNALESGDNSYYYYLYPYKSNGPIFAFLIYFATQEHAEYPIVENVLGYSTSYKIGEDVEGGPFPQYTSWVIAFTSYGSSPQNVVYQNGSMLEHLEPLEPLEPLGSLEEGDLFPYIYFLYPYVAPQRSILRMSLYTNNSQVYYKSNSLSSGIGSVRNHRAKKYRT
jgi:hypothetical protein